MSEVPQGLFRLGRWENLGPKQHILSFRPRSRFVGYTQGRLRELLEAARCVSVVDVPSCYKAKELGSKAEVATQKKLSPSIPIKMARGMFSGTATGAD